MPGLSCTGYPCSRLCKGRTYYEALETALLEIGLEPACGLPTHLALASPSYMVVLCMSCTARHASGVGLDSTHFAEAWLSLCARAQEPVT